MYFLNLFLKSKWRCGLIIFKTKKNNLLQLMLILKVQPVYILKFDSYGFYALSLFTICYCLPILTIWKKTLWFFLSFNAVYYRILDVLLLPAWHIIRDQWLCVDEKIMSFYIHWEMPNNQQLLVTGICIEGLYIQFSESSN